MNSIVFDPVGQGFVLFPIYLLNKNAESMSSGEVYEFLTDNPYELTGTKEEIKEFYAKSGVYSVKEDANQLIIQVLNDSFTYNLSKDAFSICIEEQQDQVTVIINRVIE